MADDRFTFEQLCSHAGVPGRTVRYYIQRGLVGRPIGETRGAYYTTDHLDQLLQVRKWVAAGLSLERIGELLADPPEDMPHPKRKAGDVVVSSHIHVADGVEVVIDPTRAGMTPQQVREFARQVVSAYLATKETQGG